MAAKTQPSEELQSWLDAISSYEREFKKWEGRVEKILKRYRDESRDNKDSSAKFNILWSNVQTLVPATFSRLPVPDVTRRFKDNDPVGRVAAQILERALDFEIQHYQDYRATLGQSVHDRFLGGRGTSWIRYEPHFRAIDTPVNGLQVTEDIDEPEVQEQLDYECAPVDYVHWKDFGHNVARTWEEVTQVWRKVYMNESAVRERFGAEIAKKIPYDATPEDLKRASRDGNAVKKQALVIELWDKEKNCAVWISKALKQELDRRDDPLGLQDFFPCPKPLLATITNDSLVPVPDFTLYQDQANQLDILADRIAGLGEMLQLKGVYDASQPELSRLFTEGNNGALLPVKNYAAFAEKGGLAGGVDVMDLTQLANAMKIAQETMEQVKNQVYEITGISDIIRGQTEASETATAQNIKGQYAALRLKSTQQSVAEYATAILRLKAQTMCMRFDPKTIMAMAAVEQMSQEDQQVVPQAMALLVGQERMIDPAADSPNPMRAFRIEIAADTLVELDEQQEKMDRMEFLEANGTFLEKAVGIMGVAGPAAPVLLPAIMELWKFGITAFKVGKSVEGTLDQAAEKLKEMAAQPQAAQVDPAQLQEQAMQQAKQQVMVENAQKEVALNKRAADLDIKDIQMQAREQEFALKEQLTAQARQMEDEHRAKLADVDRQAQDMDRQYKEALDGVAQREREMELNEKTSEAERALRDESTKAADNLKSIAEKAKDGAEKTPEKEGPDVEKLIGTLLESHDSIIKALVANKT